MRRIDTVVVGAGQAGLALSHHLSARGRDHVLLERGQVAQRWRARSWDSLRLLTPNWMSRLPGWCYDGPDPDGFMAVGEVVDHLERYARSFAAPVEAGTMVEIVERAGAQFLVATDRGCWRADQVVIATGHADRPHVPEVSPSLRPWVHQTTPGAYRNPGWLPPGGVLVVGAAASGVQIADELARAGRRVVLATGRHSRLPRRYRGMDIMWWLERLGVLHKTIDTVSDPVRARREPSLHLVGRPDGENLDLPALAARGVEIAGRLTEIDGRRVRFAADLAESTAAADATMRRLLAEIDGHIDAHGLAAEVLEPEPIRPSVSPAGPDWLDLRSAGIATVVWATGYVRRYPWLRVPVLDAAGEIRQRRGVTPVPGLYVLGLRFQHRRNSNFIDGVGRDARFVADHIVARDRTCEALGV